MAERKECQKYINCGFRKELAGCPLSCIHYKHKDEVRVVRCKDCRWAEDIESSLLRDVFVTGAKNCIIKRGDDAYGLDCSVVSPNDFCSDGERKVHENY